MGTSDGFREPDFTKNEKPECDRLDQPVFIGNVRIRNRLVLGPMAGVTDRPFRCICHEMGAGLVCTEMISANAVKYGNKKTLELAAIGEDEHPISLQIFGPDPETCAIAVQRLSHIPYDILDINMGCPMPKIVNNGEGSALMRDPDLAEEIVGACVNVSDRPVTVKMRAGFSQGNRNAPEIARRCERAGAAAVAVHGRTRDQYYTGSADWNIIREVKEAVRIPVIGNGDVRSRADAVRMMDETGCDLVMAARAARGNPWMFRNSPERPTLEDIYSMMLRHAKMQVGEKGDRIAICQMRKHIAWYTTGLPDSAGLRAQINSCASYDELKQVLQQWYESVAIHRFL